MAANPIDPITYRPATCDVTHRVLRLIWKIGLDFYWDERFYMYNLVGLNKPSG